MDNKVRVLLVEDHPDIRSLLHDALEDSGYATVIAANGDEALAILDHNQGFAGLITDIHLSGGPTGWEVASHARELDPAIAVIYMTGAHANEWRSKGVPNSNMVAKPLAGAQVVTALSMLTLKS